MSGIDAALAARDWLATSPLNFRDSPRLLWAGFWQRVWWGDDVGLERYQARVLGIEQRLDAVLKRRAGATP